jgi:hypothetical protein
MNKFLFSVWIFFISISLSPLAQAATYYVDASNGDDINDGLAPSSAWKTISKANSMIFSPGDSVLFKRGETWAGTGLKVTSSGAEGNHIVYGAYGSGDKPVITLRGPVPGWNTPANWEDQGGNVWRMPFTTQARLWLSGTEYLEAETLSDVSSTFRWYRESGYLYVYATSNPASFYTNIEASDVGDSTTVNMWQKNYVTLQNLDIRGGKYSIAIQGSTHIIVEDCNIGASCGRIGISITMGGADHPSNYNIIRNCIVDAEFDVGVGPYEPRLMDGIYLRNGANYNEVYGNTIRNWGHNCIVLGNYVSGQTVNYNKIYENDISSETSYYCRAISTEGEEGTCAYNEIYRNYIHDMNVKNQINGDHNSFYYNIVSNITRNSFTKDISMAGGFSFEAYGGHVCHDNKVYNNVIYNTDEPAVWVRHCGGGYCDSKYNNEIVNNIFINNGKNSWDGYDNIALRIDGGSEVLNNVYKNNLIYNSGATNIVYYRGDGAISVNTFNLRNGQNGDTIGNNIQSDPQFNDAISSDFTIQETSPCIDNGTDVGLTQDFDGNPVPQGSAPDIGAFEYSTTPTYFLPEETVEAEHGDLTSPMQTDSNSSASNDGYVSTPNADEGNASFTLDIQQPGNYRMQARVLAPDAGSDSFYVGLDGGDDNYTYDTIQTPTFTWDNVSLRGPSGTFEYAEFDPMVWELSQGLHTFTFHGRERDTWLDAIILKKQHFLPDQYIEAEYGEIGYPMQTDSGSGASGLYVFTPTTGQGNASFTLDIQQPGNYRMQARVLAPDAGSDSFYVGLDGGR